MYSAPEPSFLVRIGLDFDLELPYSLLRNKPREKPSIICNCWINASELPYSCKLVIALQPHTVNLKLFTGNNTQVSGHYRIQWSCCPLCKQSWLALVVC